jgi:tRNA(Ile)-lysidine synthase
VLLAALLDYPPAVRRLVLRALAERVAATPGGASLGETPHEPRPLSRREVEEILALGARGSKSLDLGAGLRAVSEYGTLRFTRAADAATPDPVPLPVPGRARFGDWQVEARPGGPGEVAVTNVGPELTVRGWRDGDRMRPVGLGGSKSLQDLFTDRKVPRALRHTLPVFESGGEIVWVAGVALDERFAVDEDAAGAVGLSARTGVGAA